MQTQVINATEFRTLPLAVLSESKTNPRRIFDDSALKELAETIRTNGVLSPLLVRPLTETEFEIVFGAPLPRRAVGGTNDRSRPRQEYDRCGGDRSAACRKPAAPRRSPDGRGAGLPFLA